MNKKIYQSDEAPTPIGPYSQAVCAGDWLYISGQIGLDPDTGQLVKGGVAEEARMALGHVLSILKAAGVGPDRIVKSSLFLTDMNDFSLVNPIYASIFEGLEAFPARETVAVKALPAGARFEISCVAYLG